MTFTTSNTTSDLAQKFRALSTDQQLALFWVIYTQMGESITPAAPGASTASPAIADGLFDQVAELSFEEQLEVQRDLVNNKNTLISREYGAMSDTTKLLFWYQLAQGMAGGQIVPYPDGYQISPEAEQLLNDIKQLEFNSQITLFRDVVAPMGVDPTGAVQNSTLGL